MKLRKVFSFFLSRVMKEITLAGKFLTNGSINLETAVRSQEPFKTKKNCPASFSQFAVSANCHFVNFLLHQNPILSTCHYVYYLFLSKCHFVNLPVYAFSTSSQCHFDNWWYPQLVMLFPCCFIKLPKCQTAFSSKCHST